MKQLYFLIAFVCLFIGNSKAQLVLQQNDTFICTSGMVINKANLAIQPSQLFNLGYNISGPVNLGFNFVFFGNSYNQINYGSSFVCFMSGLMFGLPHPWSVALPYINSGIGRLITPGFQHNDHLPGDGSTRRYQLVGVPGQRKLVVSFCNYRLGDSINFAQCYPYKATNQLILYEGSNIIEFHTKNMPASATCPVPDAGPDNAVQGIYNYNAATNIADQVYSPGRGPGDNWGATGGQYTSRRFSPIAAAPYYKVDTIPYNAWNIIDAVDTNAFYWYNAQGQQVSQGPSLNALATAPAGQNSTYFVVKYLGAAGCDTVANISDTFWVHFGNNDTTLYKSICAGEQYNFMGNNLSTAGSYTHTLTNAQGCDSVVQLQLSVHPLPVAQLLNDTPAYTCPGKAYTFITNEVSGHQYQWFKDGVAIIGANASSYNALAVGWYKVQHTNSNGCVQLSDSVALHLYDLPLVSLEADKTAICAGDTVALKASAASAQRYYWYPTNAILGDTISQTNTAQAIVIKSGALQVKIKDEHGCENWDSVWVAATPCCNIFLANAFSPNNDGLNDVYEVRLGVGKQLKEFMVYDRWGAVVYQCFSNDCAGWTGKSATGKPMDLGVYFYKLKYKCADGQDYFEKGEIHLIR